MLSGQQGADIACGVTLLATIYATGVAASRHKLFVWQREQPAARPTHEYPRFRPMPERTGRFTREPATTETEVERDRIATR